MRGVITVTAESEQAARAAAMAEYMEEGIYWEYVETDDEYPVRITEVDPL
jgi:ABC-type phosphate transport system ATPase subunit